MRQVRVCISQVLGECLCLGPIRGLWQDSGVHSECFDEGGQAGVFNLLPSPTSHWLRAVIRRTHILNTLSSPLTKTKLAPAALAKRYRSQVAGSQSTSGADVQMLTESESLIRALRVSAFQ